MPSVVRFSPNGAGAERRGPSSAAHHADLLDRVGVDRLVGAAVHAAVGLVVAVEVDAARRATRPSTGVFQIAVLDGPPPGVDRARAPDVDAHDARHRLGLSR